MRGNRHLIDGKEHNQPCSKKTNLYLNEASLWKSRRGYVWRCFPLMTYFVRPYTPNFGPSVSSQVLLLLSVSLKSTSIDHPAILLQQITITKSIKERRDKKYDPAPDTDMIEYKIAQVEKYHKLPNRDLFKALDTDNFIPKHPGDTDEFITKHPGSEWPEAIEYVISQTPPNILWHSSR